jgi:tetratricopeptide (TPR) repeat protein
VDCLAADTINEFLAGRLDPDAIRRVERHVGLCANCLDILTTAATDVLLTRGSSVGRYVILALVGRGGMGEVYAAYDPQLDRRVAVKLLGNQHSESQEGEAQARLLREAQAIGRLSHPNVVAAYDVGTWDDRVFIAMEFVEGETLAGWSRRTSRHWSEVRDVFAGAARGLAAAHEAGLIHRDFKPQNVMVDGQGRARVMDFGLARRLPEDERIGRGGQPPVDSALSDLPATLPQTLGLTRAGTLVGTPSYMAPEQFQGRPASTRSDQFSFCVALYEALYDERPFSGHDVASLREAVLAGRVRVPSVRRTVPAWLRRIVLRGLSPADEDRFPSMTALVEALERRRPRLRRRILAAGLVMSALFAGGMAVDRVGSRGERLCRSGDKRLAGVWEIAPPSTSGSRSGSRREAVHQAFIATGVADEPAIWEHVSAALDRYAHRWSAAYTDTCEATHVRGEQSAQVLDLRMTCLSEKLEQLKALTTIFTSADAPMMGSAVNATDALAPLEPCANVPVLSAVVPLPKDVGTRVAVERARQRMASVKALRDSGRIADGLLVGRQVVQAARAIEYKPLLAEALDLVGWLEVVSGDSLAAENTLAEAVQEGQTSRHDEVVAEAAAMLGGAMAEAELPLQHEAERWLEFADATLSRLGPGHERARAWLLTERAAVRCRLRDFAAALRFGRAAVALKEQALGADAPDVGNSLVEVDLALTGLGQPKDALVINDRATRIFRQSYGDGSTFVAQCLSNRGEALNALGRYPEARAAFEGAAARWTAAFGPEHRYLGYALTGLGQTQLAMKEGAAAVNTLERALAIRTRQEPNAIPVAETRFALARSLSATGDRARARTLAMQARTAYLTLPELAPVAREIERWLAAR